MSPDMFSGWGVRTLSRIERRYNPIGYHLGTVWPHDNSIIAAGFRNYGLDEAACKIFSSIVEAASHFPRHRLPEVFAGYSREQFPTPVALSRGLSPAGVGCWLHAVHGRIIARAGSRRI